jgi:hypothetical protein
MGKAHLKSETARQNVKRGVLVTFPVVSLAVYGALASGCDGLPEVIRGEGYLSGGYDDNSSGRPSGVGADGGVRVGEVSGNDAGGRGRTTRSGDGTINDAGVWVPGADGACFAASQTPDKINVQVEKKVTKKKPIAMVLMQDRSSSMVGLCDQGVACNPFAWSETTAAITTFANDPNSAGIDVGLNFFPPIGAIGDTQGACDGSSCAVPAVAVGKLPGVASALTAAFQANPPSPISFLPNYTPTECGMRGMVSVCTAFTKATGEQCVAVLITDGTPNRCSTNSAVLTQIAAAGKAAGVKTFAIGMNGANFTLLNSIAQSGGTDCDAKGPNLACDVSKGDSLLAALTAIRESVTVTETVTEVQTKQLDCQWLIPPPPAGQVFDPARVNLGFTAAGGNRQTIGFVPSAADCQKAGDYGWYFDDAKKPTRVLVCPQSCTAIQASKGASIDIAFGCARESAPPVVVR